MLDFLRMIHKKEGGIWKYADFYAEKILSGNMLELGDGDTPLVENKPLDKELAIDHLYFKREDENETGSLKGRSLAYQVSLNRQRGAKALVISTSGNAGIAAAAYAKKAGLRIFIFISPDTEKGKIADMQSYDPVIIKSRRAMRLANYVATRYGFPNMRPSVDDDSIEGFKSIAFEIADEAEEVDAVFTYVTSGSSFIGMYRGFEAYKTNGKINKIPAMYAVQSGGISSIAEEFEENGCMIAKEEDRSETEIRAGQHGVKNTRRKTEILDIIRKTGGSGMYVSESEISQAKDMLLKNDIKTSLEGCASFAGFLKMRQGQRFSRAVCILSGKSRSADAPVDETKIYSAESLEDVDRVIKDSI